MPRLLALPRRMLGDLWSFHPQPRLRRPHRHDDLELNIVLRGQSSYLLGEKRYPLARGTVVWLFPDQDHLLLDETPDFLMWVGVFRPSLVRRVCRSVETRRLQLRNPPGEFCRVLPPNWLRRLDALAADVAARRNGDPDLFHAGLSYLLLSAWGAFCGAEAVTAGLVHPAVERAARLLHNESSDEKLSVLSTRVGLSPSRLSRLFKEQLGTPLVIYRQQQCLRRFFQLLETPSAERPNLLACAMEAGFGSYAQFHRVFKSVCGVSPREHFGKPKCDRQKLRAGPANKG